MTLFSKFVKITVVSSKVIVGTLSSIAVSTLSVGSADASSRSAAGSGASAGTIGGIATGTIVAGAVAAGVAAAVVSSRTVLADAIRGNADGALNSSNIAQALQQTYAQNPTATQSQWAAALNLLNLDAQTLQIAVETVSEVSGAEVSDIVSTMITDTYTTQGAASAREQVADMRDSLGDDTVSAALDTSVESNDAPDANDADDSIYNG